MTDPDDPVARLSVGLELEQQMLCLLRCFGPFHRRRESHGSGAARSTSKQLELPESDVGRLPVHQQDAVVVLFRFGRTLVYPSMTDRAVTARR